MFSLFTTIKFIHILLAIIAFGFNATYAIWITRAQRHPEHLDFALRGVKILDDYFANPAYLLLLASGLTGLAESSARWWLPRKGTVSRDEAVSLMSSLAWRGISGFPRIEGEHH